MFKRFIITAGFFFCMGLSAAMLAENGQTEYVIAVGESPMPAERTAASELARYLEKITDAKFEIVREAETPAGKKAVFVGHTKFAVRHGIDVSKLHDEEWIEKLLPDGNLILTGGHANGILYSVFDFLEKQGGCRWLDAKQEVVPHKKAFPLNGLNIRKEPAFRLRMIFDLCDWYPDSIAFKTKNKGHAYANAEWGGGFRYGRPGQHHTFHFYSSRFPAGREDWFSLDRNGKRLHAKNGIGPGQICMTNPDARKAVLDTLREFIRKDRQEAAEKGWAPPVIYDISQNDNINPCVCASCRALAEKEGSYSAPLIDFINYLAAGIAKEHPEITVRTFAYDWGINPPKTIRPASNVLIHLAVLGAEFGGNERRDTMRPLSAKTNAYALNLLKTWGTISKIGMWDYWTLYSTDFPSPYSNVSVIAENIRLCRDFKVTDMFIENEINPYLSFFPLKRYLGYKLLEDPSIDDRAVVSEFINLYYGKPAAPFMLELLEYMERRQNEIKGPFAKKYITLREYLDRDFFIRSFGLLDKAEAAVKGDSARTDNIRRERIPFLSALFLRWPMIDGIEKDFQFGSMLKQFETEMVKTIKYYHMDLPPENFYTRQMNHFKKMDVQFRSADLKVPVPERFRGKRVISVSWPYFLLSGKARIENVPGAVGGKAAVLGPDSPGRTKNGRTDFGIYNSNRAAVEISRAVKNSDLPKTEKFQLYFIGTVYFRNPLGRLYCGSSWGIQCSLLPVIEEGKAFDVYVSARFSGPDYYPGSKSPCALAVDYAIFVENKEFEPMPEKVDVKTPPEFSGRNVTVHAWNAFVPHGSSKLVRDSSAAGGKAFFLPLTNAVKNGAADFGVYHPGSKKVLTSARVLMANVHDEAWHLVKVGEFTMPEGKVFFYGGASWETQCPLSSAGNAGKSFELFTSVRFTGRTENHGPDQTHGMFCDYILLVKK